MSVNHASSGGRDNAKQDDGAIEAPIKQYFRSIKFSTARGVGHKAMKLAWVDS